MAERQAPAPETGQADGDDDVAREPLATRDMVVDNRVVWPPLLVTLGFVVAFLTFVVQHWIPLVAGFLLMLIGTVLSLASRK